MKTICLYFEIHQIIHLKRYRFFDIGTEQYYYDEKGYLRFMCSSEKDFSVRRLFHLLNQAKESLALVVKENMEVYEVLLEILQMHRNR